MKHEIELKFKINNVELFQRQATKLGVVFGPEKRQIDRIYLLEGSDFEDLKRGNPVLRIRDSAGKLTSTAKRYVDGVSNRLESDIDISDYESIDQYFTVLGFVEVVCVDKKRIEGKYLEAVITLDDVDGLGTFAEIEVVCEEELVEVSKRKIFEIAELLSLASEDLIDEPYDVMLYRSKGS